MKKPRRCKFLPVSREEMNALGWDECDIVLISGDAYVDHPSFGVAMIGRVLEDAGYKVGIIPQPDIKDKSSFTILGEPRFCFGVSSGNVDSMVSNYTANRRIRSEDDYSPGGRGGKRPDRAVTVYCNKIRETYKEKPIIIGGIEASLRRFAHYDYWDDRVRQSILADAPASMIAYGMAEKPMIEIMKGLEKGDDISELTNIRGTVYKTREISRLEDYVELPDYNEVSKNKISFANSFKTYSDEQDPIHGKTLVQRHPKTIIVQNTPSYPLTTEEMDNIYELPYARKQHPSYKEEIPALRTTLFSITSHRGCFGGCSFCAIANHQGRIIQSRSKGSIINEAKLLTKMPEFKGVITDVGGPTADMYMMGCAKQATQGTCKDRMCLYPEPCPNLKRDHEHIVQLLKAVKSVPGVKKVFIGSGIRYDLAMLDESYLYEICKNNISGQLKVAPEHVSKEVTDLMCKPSIERYRQFVEKYRELNKKLGKEQYIIPYFISGHPGATLECAIELAEYVRDMGYYIEQVQDFTPTPSTLSGCMYHTEYNPYTGKKVYVPKSKEERRMQRALLQYKNPDNYDLVKEALMKAGRKDLIGNSEKCLIPRSRPLGYRRK
ncbi:YgiQ family radical SAM protein [Methanocella sp. CWC-04]|uniref:YgiQ family radical SAM protein n=2 Tax=Methanooceanicella nereidis TaxID=2052831 RepID=A0AAP2W822_9EURY|nr:YgiQ family radical SAM protein [Methanocella sp. CWC-04]